MEIARKYGAGFDSMALAQSLTVRKTFERFRLRRIRLFGCFSTVELPNRRTVERSNALI